MSNLSIESFKKEFTQITGINPNFSSEYSEELAKLIEFLKNHRIRPFKERKKEFLGHINWKFRFNAEPIAAFLKTCAFEGYTFNYHEKMKIQRAFDLSEASILNSVLADKGVPSKLHHALSAKFLPNSLENTLNSLRDECLSPSKLRIEQGKRDIHSEISMAHFSSFMWVSLPSDKMHEFFDPEYFNSEYKELFWEQLHTRSPKLFNRDNALHIICLDQDSLSGLNSIDSIRDAVCSYVKVLYKQITNYGFLALIIKPIRTNGRNIEWEIAADTILFAEKHIEYALKKGYFRPEVIKEKTLAHISNLNVQAANFDLVNEGFTYKDCFVLSRTTPQIDRLVLIFQKNERDETLIPCPACRSINVQGNSYSSLGVKSWECNNVLCPERSKYNRGKRYSFRGIAMQQAIDDDRNTIPVDCVRRWNKDVVYNFEEHELPDFLVRHYSIWGDTIHLHNWDSFPTDYLGRKTKKHKLTFSTHPISFWNGSFFARYAFRSNKHAHVENQFGDESFKVFQGDSSKVLRSLPGALCDGAVTSPPYYNAKEYSQWPNIYCHLHDMFDINTEVYRILKPGAFYLYNVFDYFDNENTVVLSAMGQRRMILSAYTVDIFRRIGFVLEGNIVWDKGDIEGKRGFNAGNFSPYYQAPFNCWEHILVFRKPISCKEQSFRNIPKNTFRNDSITIASKILKQKPVFKIINGENKHGHSAPFPEAIPNLLISQLKPDSLILDPFAGSLTTGRAAEIAGLRSLCIEQSIEYCNLGLSFRAKHVESEAKKPMQYSLF